ncbi:hypothetical protein AB7M16_000005 [Bradyrhizobium sp. USDA 372]
MSDAIKLKVLPKFPAKVIGGAGVDVTVANGDYTFDLDFTDFPVIGTVPAGTTYALIFNPATGQYAQLPISMIGGFPDAPSDGSSYGRRNAAWSAVTPEAPADGQTYGRKNSAWSVVTSGISDAPSDGSPYGRLNAAWAKLRTLLTANRTYYVATTGSDSNDGLTAATPFLTIQKALNVVYGTLDLGGQTVTIQLADGSYTQAAAIVINGAQVGAGTIRLIGNTSTPANVIVTCSNDNALIFNGPGAITIDGMEVRATSGYGLKAAQGWTMTLGAAMRYGAVTYGQIYASTGARVTVNSPTIVGSAGTFVRADYGGFAFLAGVPITLVGTPAFSNAFVAADAYGFVDIFSNTFTGTATGKRYTASHGGAINTNGGGVNYLPGNVAGDSATGAYY